MEILVAVGISIVPLLLVVGFVMIMTDERNR